MHLYLYFVCILICPVFVFVFHTHIICATDMLASIPPLWLVRGSIFIGSLVLPMLFAFICICVCICICTCNIKYLYLYSILMLFVRPMWWLLFPLVRGFIFIGSWVLLKSHLSHACHTYYPQEELGEIIRGSNILCLY